MTLYSLLCSIPQSAIFKTVLYFYYCIWYPFLYLNLKYNKCSHNIKFLSLPRPNSCSSFTLTFLLPYVDWTPVYVAILSYIESNSWGTKLVKCMKRSYLQRAANGYRNHSKPFLVSFNVRPVLISEVHAVTFPTATAETLQYSNNFWT